MFFEISVEFAAYYRVERDFGFGIAEFGLSLPLELNLLHFYH